MHKPHRKSRMICRPDVPRPNLRRAKTSCGLHASPFFSVILPEIPRKKKPEKRAALSLCFQTTPDLLPPTPTKRLLFFTSPEGMDGALRLDQPLRHRIQGR
jgi:hypothetical protein